MGMCAVSEFEDDTDMCSLCVSTRSDVVISSTESKPMITAYVSITK